jgi:dTDP-4-dehydrorhamnose 3,5-epimerase
MEAPGVRDEATVTRDGRSLAPSIDGVRTFAPVTHIDHRGRVFEIWPEESDYWSEPFVYAYAFTIRPGVTKGWGVHDHKHDRYTLIAGEVLLVLYDDRPESGTRGVIQRIMLAPEAVRQVTIPPGVWHLNVNVGHTEAQLINFPTLPYDHARPDRRTLPVSNEHIPFDATQVFPTQWR